MKNPRLHFPVRRQPDVPLSHGVHRIVRDADGVTCIAGEAASGQLLARLCLDRRGLWLQVAEGGGSVHVNGRPVQRVALLRPGDAIYLGGEEMLVQGTPGDPASAMPAAGARDDDPRVVLRGVGGLCHGRSFTLSRSVTVGNGPAAEIPVEGADVAEAHAVLERRGDHISLLDLGSVGGSVVNGVSVREALLSAGDQVVFGARNRFVLEVPWLSNHRFIQHAPAVTGPVDEAADNEVSHHGGQQVSVLRWPWLLLAAALLGLVLSALLLFGAH